jgi:ribonuclease G
MDILLSNVKSLKAHSLVYKPEKKYLSKIRDLNLNEFEKITTDDVIIFDQLSSYFQANIPNDLPKLTYYNDASYSLHKLHQINKKIQDIQNKMIYLKNGATLLIEQTEAMNVIDVNSGKAIKGTAKEETFYKVNIIAAKEIARQIRLRNLSGIIIIDFINMKEKGNIDKLIAFLSNLLKNDPVKTQFIDITKLGLIELTRKRISPSMKEQLFIKR